MEQNNNSITTIDQAKDLIGNLQNSTNYIGQQILSAQLQVLTQISSPELVGSSFDIMLTNIKEVLSSSESDSFKEVFRKNSILLIQNYIFFMKAKLVFIRSALEKENEIIMREKYALMRDATKGLVKCFEGTLAMSGNKWIGNIKIDITEISRYMEEKGLIDRFFDWLNRKEIQKQNYQKSKALQLEFDKIMGELPIKLYSYHKYIGNSTLIAGIITSYKKEIFDKLDPSKSSREGKVRRVHSGIKSDFIDSLSINVGLTILIYPLTLIVPGLLWCIWKIFGGEVEIFESCLNWALTKASIYAIVYLVCSSILITLKIIGDYFFKYKPLVVENNRINKEVQEKFERLYNAFGAELETL